MTALPARPLLVVVGVFLDAGKTTAVLGAAERLRRTGRKVAIITNDQGSDIVDTATRTRLMGVPHDCDGKRRRPATKVAWQTTCTKVPLAAAGDATLVAVICHALLSAGR